MWFTSLISKGLSFFGMAWVKWALAAVLAGLLVLLWLDYQSAKSEAATYKEKYTVEVTKLQSQIDLNKKNEQTHLAIEQGLREDIALSASIAKEMKVRDKKLQSQIVALQKIRRKKQNENCPLHPAIVYAFDLLRSENSNSTSAGTVSGNTVTP